MRPYKGQFFLRNHLPLNHPFRYPNTSRPPHRTLTIALANAARHLILIAALPVGGRHPQQHQLRQIAQPLLSRCNIIRHPIQIRQNRVVLRQQRSQRFNLSIVII